MDDSVQSAFDSYHASSQSIEDATRTFLNQIGGINVLFDMVLVNPVLSITDLDEVIDDINLAIADERTSSDQPAGPSISQLIRRELSRQQLALSETLVRTTEKLLTSHYGRQEVLNACGYSMLLFGNDARFKCRNIASQETTDDDGSQLQLPKDQHVIMHAFRPSTSSSAFQRVKSYLTDIGSPEDGGFVDLPPLNRADDIHQFLQEVPPKSHLYSVSRNPVMVNLGHTILRTYRECLVEMINSLLQHDQTAYFSTKTISSVKPSQSSSLTPHWKLPTCFGNMLVMALQMDGAPVDIITDLLALYTIYGLLTNIVLCDSASSADVSSQFSYLFENSSPSAINSISRLLLSRVAPWLPSIDADAMPDQFSSQSFSHHIRSAARSGDGSVTTFLSSPLTETLFDPTFALQLLTLLLTDKPPAEFFIASILPSNTSLQSSSTTAFIYECLIPACTSPGILFARVATSYFSVITHFNEIYSKLASWETSHPIPFPEVTSLTPNHTPSQWDEKQSIVSSKLTPLFARCATVILSSLFSIKLVDQTVDFITPTFQASSSSLSSTSTSPSSFDLTLSLSLLEILSSVGNSIFGIHFLHYTNAFPRLFELLSRLLHVGKPLVRTNQGHLQQQDASPSPHELVLSGVQEDLYSQFPDYFHNASHTLFDDEDTQILTSYWASSCDGDAHTLVKGKPVAMFQRPRLDQQKHSHLVGQIFVYTNTLLKIAASVAQQCAAIRYNALHVFVPGFSHLLQSLPSPEGHRVLDDTAQNYDYFYFSHLFSHLNSRAQTQPPGGSQDSSPLYTDIYTFFRLLTVCLHFEQLSPSTSQLVGWLSSQNPVILLAPFLLLPLLDDSEDRQASHALEQQLLSYSPLLALTVLYANADDTVKSSVLYALGTVYNQQQQQQHSETGLALREPCRFFQDITILTKLPRLLQLFGRNPAQDRFDSDPLIARLQSFTAFLHAFLLSNALVFSSHDVAQITKQCLSLLDPSLVSSLLDIQWGQCCTCGHPITLGSPMGRPVAGPDLHPAVDSNKVLTTRYIPQQDYAQLASLKTIYSYTVALGIAVQEVTTVSKSVVEDMQFSSLYVLLGLSTTSWGSLACYLLGNGAVLNRLGDDDYLSSQESTKLIYDWKQRIARQLILTSPSGSIRPTGQESQPLVSILYTHALDMCQHEYATLKSHLALNKALQQPDSPGTGAEEHPVLTMSDAEVVDEYDSDSDDGYGGFYKQRFAKDRVEPPSQPHNNTEGEDRHAALSPAHNWTLPQRVELCAFTGPYSSLAHGTRAPIPSGLAVSKATLVTRDLLQRIHLIATTHGMIPKRDQLQILTQAQ